jgi:hypothetical protein
MSNAEQLIAFLREHPNSGYCDACLAQMAKLTSRRQVQDAITRLEDRDSLIRRSGKCKQCGKVRYVTWAI